MDTIMRIEIDFLALLIGVILIVDLQRNSGKVTRNRSNLNAIICSLIALQALDAVQGALDGHSGTAVFIAKNLIMFLYYIINNLVPLLWALYVRKQVYLPRRRRVKLKQWLFYMPFIISILIVLINPFTGNLYYFDSSNNYFRGGLFYLNVALCFSYLFYSIFFPVIHHSRVENKQIASIIIFSSLPMFGAALMFVFPQTNLMWSTATVSALAIYLGFLNDNMTIDYLTGLNNRMQSDYYADLKIEKSSLKHTFSGILLDIDKFKLFNDRFGHHAGDEALIATARLLKKSVRKRDFIARIGGDEFLIILETDNPEKLESAVKRIEHEVERYNRTSHLAFPLKLSMGYAVYDYSLKLSRQQFIRYIDRLMYKQKTGQEDRTVQYAEIAE